MEANVKAYRNVLLRLGLMLLLFEGLFEISSTLLTLVLVPFYTHFLNPMGIATATQLSQGVLYLLSFMLPTVLFRLTASDSVPVEPMHLGVRLPKETPLYVLGSMAVILSAAYLNAYFVDWFAMGPSINEQIESVGIKNYEIVLTFFTTALVPAVCEEFLFRGVVLSNLLPYNRTAAVVISAVCFGMMHRNAGQVLYATIAGLVLAILVIRTGSIWCSMLVHLFNNFFSVVESVIITRLDELTAMRWIALLDFSLLALGFVCIVVLLLPKPRDWRDDGCFGQTVSALQLAESRPIPAEKLFRASLSPALIAFLVACVGVMYLNVVVMQWLG